MALYCTCLRQNRAAKTGGGVSAGIETMPSPSRKNVGRRGLYKTMSAFCIGFVEAARFSDGQLLFFAERQLALTVTERVSFGAALIALCNSSEEEKTFPLICRAGK